MKIKINDNDGTIRFISEGAHDLFPLGKLAERLKGRTYPLGGDQREIMVEQTDLVKFLTQ